jgi:hypothetical protein
MKRIVIGLVLAGGLLMFSCGGDDESTSSGDGGSTSTNNGGSGNTGGGPMGGNGNTGGDPFAGDVCSEHAGDSLCIGCVREGCCTELGACEPDAECNCLVACFFGGTDPIMCVNQCGQSTAVTDLIACATGGCGTECAAM